VNFIYYLVAALAGMANPAQAGANAELRKSTDDAIFSAVIVYISGLIFMLFVQFIGHRGWPNGAKLAMVPWWAWTGGLLSLASTLAGITLAQRLGSGAFTGITVTASITMSILFDHFGWLGFKQHTASLPRVAGGALMIIGLWLVARF
jgi:transporter family-2 protein